MLPAMSHIHFHIHGGHVQRPQHGTAAHGLGQAPGPVQAQGTATASMAPQLHHPAAAAAASRLPSTLAARAVNPRSFFRPTFPDPEKLALPIELL